MQHPNLNDIRTWFNQFSAAGRRFERELQLKDEEAAQRLSTANSRESCRQRSALDLSEAIKKLCEDQSSALVPSEDEKSDAVLEPLVIMHAKASDLRSQVTELTSRRKKVEQQYFTALTREIIVCLAVGIIGLGIIIRGTFGLILVILALAGLVGYLVKSFNSSNYE